MKKVLIIIGLLLAVNLLIFSANKTFAAGYDANFKKSFYDGYLSSTWEALKQSLLEQGFEANSVNKYISILKINMNRTKLEDATWNCVKTFTPEQMKDGQIVYDKCFADFMNDFVFVRNRNNFAVLQKQ
jgi:hypothetical protein